MKKIWLVVCVAALGCGEDMSNNMSMDLTMPDLQEAADLQAGHCEPIPVPNFQPMWKPPTSAHQNRCTTQQITDGVAAVLSRSFASFTAANADCAACILTPSTMAQHGPLVTFATLGIIDGNRDGCVAIWTGDYSDMGCAAKVQAQSDCGIATCQPNCPIMTNADLADFNTCAGKAFAAGGTCDSYVTDCPGTVGTDAGTGVPSDCFLGNQGVSVWFTYLVTLFCGA